MNHMNENIKSLIEESSAAYELYFQNGAVNSDFADFASLSFQEFKTLLGRPEMTQREVRRMVRKGYFSHRLNAPQTCWASYIASYMKQATNAN